MSEYQQLVDEYQDFDHLMLILERVMPNATEDSRAEIVYDFLEECDE